MLIGLITSADAIRIGQGDDVFQGEYVDLSLAVAWPDFTVVWCKDGDSGCNPPDQIITIDKFQHNYYIDPEIFHPGWYYRWSGEWNRGEYSNAFRVRTGTRPAPVVNLTPTPTPTPEPGIDTRGNGPFEYLVARGDNIGMTFHYKSDDVCGTGGDNDEAHLWLFGTLGSTDSLMDIPLKTLGNGDYMLHISSDDTFGLDVGKYNGYVQFPGLNGRRDVYWDNLGQCLDTPYDDAIVPDVAVNLLNPEQVQKSFDALVYDAKYSDDLIVPIVLTMKQPEIIITDIVQGEETLWISGTTTWWNETEMTIRLDPDNYALAQDKAEHTWTTKATGNQIDYRRFSLEVPISMKDMYVGAHELKITIEKNRYATDVYHTFEITTTYVMPTPTPYIKKYISGMNNSGVNVVTMAPTPTPAPAYVAYAGEIPVNTTVQTTAPTPVPSKTPVKTPTPVPTPTPTKDNNVYVPGFPWWVAVMAIGFAWWRLR